MATMSSSEPADDQTAEPTATTPQTPAESESNQTAEQPRGESTAAATPATDRAADTVAEPVTTTAAPVADPAQPTVVFVQAPVPPKKRGARGVGFVVALLGAALFAAAYALLVIIIGLLEPRFGIASALQSLSTVTFYVPVIVFFLAYVLLIVIVNRAGWWAHVLGGFIVAVVVWIGFVGAAIIAAGVFGGSAADVNAVVQQQLTNPLGFAAAIAAREVPIWVGGLVSRRGRTARARNDEARAAYEAELAEHRATLGTNQAV